MSKKTSYGSFSQFLGPNFTALNIEVKRDGARQRLVSVVASYMPEQKPGGIPTPVDDTIVGRLLVYRGFLPADDTDLRWTTFSGGCANVLPWESLFPDSGLRVIVDVFVPWHSHAFQQDFSTWPDAIVRADVAEPIGALLMQPVYCNSPTDAFATACLTLQGTDTAGDPEADKASKWVAK